MSLSDNDLLQNYVPFGCPTSCSKHDRELWEVDQTEGSYVAEQSANAATGVWPFGGTIHV